MKKEDKHQNLNIRIDTVTARLAKRKALESFEGNVSLFVRQAIRSFSPEPKEMPKLSKKFR